VAIYRNSLFSDLVSHFTIKIRKHACTPILLGVKCLAKPITVPWLDNRQLKFEWTA
jgi:hypothetical protein